MADERMVARALQPLGLAYQGQGNLPGARRHLEEALALAHGLGDKRELAGALNAVAQLARLQGDADAAEPLYENVVALARELDDRESIAIGLLNLAMVSIIRRIDHRAKHMLLEVLAISAETGSKPAGQSLLEVCAGFAASLQEWAQAARFYGVAEAQTGETGLHRDPADEAFLSPLIENARRNLGASAFATAEAGGRTLHYDQALAEARDWLMQR
jgi:tetratricopeptide (TPR) repeat protein